MSFKTPVRDAATVILVRKSRLAPFEVFLMRRHRAQSFMGGAFVFPGGTADPADAFPEDHQFENNHAFLTSLDRMTQGGISRDRAKSLFTTAIRETFEEAGVLFARSPGKPPGHEGVLDGMAVDSARKQIHDQVVGLDDIIKAQGLLLAPEALLPYARWITPEMEKKRFDTWFFIARMPEGQKPAHDDVELVDSCWMTPASALAQNDAGRLHLMPPTLKTLLELQAFESAEQLFSTVGTKQILPILPQAMGDEIRFGVKLPHDPEYTITAYKQLPRPAEPSRILIKDGRWSVERPS